MSLVFCQCIRSSLPFVLWWLVSENPSWKPNAPWMPIHRNMWYDTPSWDFILLVDAIVSEDVYWLDNKWMWHHSHSCFVQIRPRSGRDWYETGGARWNRLPCFPVPLVPWLWLARTNWINNLNYIIRCEKKKRTEWRLFVGTSSCSRGSAWSTFSCSWHNNGAPSRNASWWGDGARSASSQRRAGGTVLKKKGQLDWGTCT